jgi:hypothetical protein
MTTETQTTDTLAALKARIALVPNAHAINVQYLGPTESKAGRVRLTSQRFEKDAVTIGYDYEFNGACSTATAWLMRQGYTVLWHAETPKGYLIGVAEFRPLRGE